MPGPRCEALRCGCSRRRRHRRDRCDRLHQLLGRRLKARFRTDLGSARREGQRFPDLVRRCAGVAQALEREVEGLAREFRRGRQRRAQRLAEPDRCDAVRVARRRDEGHGKVGR